MRLQNERLKNARFASRDELCSTPGEVLKRQDGVLQQADRSESAGTRRALIYFHGAFP